MSKPRLLLTGGTGQLGGALKRILPPFCEVFAPNRSELDLSDLSQVTQVVMSFKPDVIINSGAYTAVDLAEDEPAKAHVINGEAPEIIARAANAIDAHLIHISTDYVFDGAGHKPYLETDETGPVNVYGQSKLAGERGILSNHEQSLILRVAWLYDISGHNFLKTMLRLADTHPELTVVDDQIGAPTYVEPLAQSISTLVKRSLQGTPVTGLYHVPTSGQTSWFGFAQAIFELRQRLTSKPPPRLKRTTTEAYPTRATRPKYSKLDGSKLARSQGIELPSWQSQLHAAMVQLYSA